MKESLLNYLLCPVCAGELAVTSTTRSGDEILDGYLVCRPGDHRFPIRRGVPRFADLANDEIQRDTAANFGAQWIEFDQVEAHHQQQFLDWISPVTPDFVRGKLVVEGGCGKGRHTRAIAEWGAQAIIGVDLSDAVDVAFRNTHDLPNVHIIQADIYRLPLRPVFDYAFSVGVLHHLPAPRRGFESLVQKLRPGGAISAWVYGAENNGWIVNYVNPLRERLTSKLPMRALYGVSYPIAGVLYVFLKLLYAPLAGTRLSRLLFYPDYLCYIARFPFREIHNIVHDHLTAPVAFYISREEFQQWFGSAAAERTEIHWHNRNSWRGFGFIPSAKQAEARHAGS